MNYNKKAVSITDQVAKLKARGLSIPDEPKAAFFNINKKKLEKQGVNVEEWNKKSKGKK